MFLKIPPKADSRVLQQKQQFDVAKNLAAAISWKLWQIINLQNMCDS